MLLDSDGGAVDVLFLCAEDTLDYTNLLSRIVSAFGIGARVEDVGTLASSVSQLEHLDSLFDDSGHLLVCMLSDEYEDLRFSADDYFRAHQWAMNELSHKLVEVRLDPVKLPSIESSLVLVDNPSWDIPTSIAAIKSGLDGVEAWGRSSGNRRVRVPIDDAGRALLMHEMPEGWRVALGASFLSEAIARCEYKWEEHRRGDRKLTGLHFGRHQAEKFLQRVVLDDLKRFLSEFSARVEVLDRASGESDELERSATNFARVYEEVLDWAARLRGASTPPAWARMVSVSAQLADSLLLPVRQFVVDYHAMAEEMLNGEGERHRNLTVKFDMDSQLMDLLLEEYVKVR